MKYVNIPRCNQDPNYRYKMPEIEIHFEGR